VLVGKDASENLSGQCADEATVQFCDHFRIAMTIVARPGELIFTFQHPIRDEDEREISYQIRAAAMPVRFGGVVDMPTNGPKGLQALPASWWLAVLVASSLQPRLPASPAALQSLARASESRRETCDER
jgi:hypothetical protein